MRIIPKLIKQTTDYFRFELPEVVIFQGNQYKMSSSSNLMRALNTAEMTLSDIFDVDSYKGDVHKLCIYRRKLQLPRHVSSDDRRVFVEQQIIARKEANIARNCIVCGKKTIKSRYMVGTCSVECRAAKIAKRNLSVTAMHWTKRHDADEITKRRCATRIANDKKFKRTYIPWNKGKTGIYSPETIAKISAATLRQFATKRIRKTKIERLYEQLLIELDVKYTYSMIYCRRQFDFYLPQIRTFVEIQGDFWHANPKFWGNDVGLKQLREHQKIKRDDDVSKKKLVIDAGYQFVEFWEYDIHNNWNDIVLKTKELLQ